MTGRLRLLKVHLQPVFVVDDGETLSEQPGAPIEVTGGNWRAFAATAFGAEEMAELQAQWEASQPASANIDPGPALDSPRVGDSDSN